MNIAPIKDKWPVCGMQRLLPRIEESLEDCSNLFRRFKQIFGSSSPPYGKTTDRRELEEIITHELVTPVFQPVISLDNGAVYGYEALSRITRPGGIATPEEMFVKAAEYGLARPIEMLCRKKALIHAKEQNIPGKIFLNVSPAVLLAGDHERGRTAALLDELQIERSRIVLELTERTLIEDYDLFHWALCHYRDQGYSIAIDDLGSGYAGLKMLTRIDPDYVKLSRFLVAAIDNSATKQALVEALVSFCRKTGATVIAEGIERPEELEFLAAVQVPLGQGYLLGRPSSKLLSPP